MYQAVKNSVSVHVRLDKKVLRQLDLRVLEDDTTRSFLLNQAVKMSLGKLQPRPVGRPKMRKTLRKARK